MNDINMWCRLHGCLTHIILIASADHSSVSVYLFCVVTSAFWFDLLHGVLLSTFDVILQVKYAMFKRYSYSHDINVGRLGSQSHEIDYCAV